MSLLDQLAEQAKQRKAQEELEQAARDELTAYYRSYTAPLMRKLFAYLKQLTAHLTFLKESQTVAYDIPHIGWIESEVEPGFETRFSEVEDRMEILLLGKAQIPQKRQPDLLAEGPKVELVESSLRERGIRGKKQARKNADGSVLSAQYWIFGEIIRKGTIVATTGSREVTFDFVNFDILGSHKRVIEGQALDDEGLFDRLGRYVAGADRDFFREEVSSDSRQQWQQHMREEEKRKEREILAHDEQPTVSVVESVDSGLKERMKQQFLDLKKRLRK